MRTAVSLRTWLVLVFTAVTAADISAQGEASPLPRCDEIFAQDFLRTVDAAVCYFGFGNGLESARSELFRSTTVRELAEIFAPVLLFTDDEIEDHEGAPVPTLLPCDDEGTGSPDRTSPVVYFQLASARPGDSATDETLTLTADLEFTLLYSFYYPAETGLGAHMHDLEGLEVRVRVEGLKCTDREVRTANGRVRNRSVCEQLALRLVEVKGLAHGKTYYANSLRPRTGTAPVSLPLRVFVEEGKHATSPDRNADRNYTPGIDVTEYLSDAWGVRDVISEGTVFEAPFAAWMTKERSESGEVWPEDWELSRAKTGEDQERLYRLRAASETTLPSSICRVDGRAVLRNADPTWDSAPEPGGVSHAAREVGTVGFGTAVRQQPRVALVNGRQIDHADLDDMVNDRRFGKPPRRVSAADLSSSEGVQIYQTAVGWFAPVDIKMGRATFGYRWNGEHWLEFNTFAIHIPMFGLWVSFPTAIGTEEHDDRGTFRSSTSVRLASSATRWVDWHASLGWETDGWGWGFTGVATPLIELYRRDLEPKWVGEAGVRIRTPRPGVPCDWLEFCSIVVGVRSGDLAGLRRSLFFIHASVGPL